MIRTVLLEALGQSQVYLKFWRYLNVAGNVSYADCFTLASAIELKTTIVTGDPDFKKVGHLVGIVWV